MSYFECCIYFFLKLNDLHPRAILNSILDKVLKFFIFPANIYLFKINSRNAKKMLWNIFRVNNKSTRTTSTPPENIRKPLFFSLVNLWFSDVFRGIHIVLVFLLLTLDIFHTFFLVCLLLFLNKEMLAGLFAFMKNIIFQKLSLYLFATSQESLEGL